MQEKLETSSSVVIQVKFLFKYIPAIEPSVAPTTLIRNKSGEENKTPIYIRIDAGMSLMA